MDIKSKEARSANMRAIRNRDTGPEMIVRRLLFAAGFRFRLHVKSLPGNPDIVLPKWKTVIFVNGCFWHVHEGCPRAVLPRSNVSFWEDKLSRNRIRDREEQSVLLAAGWRVLIVWECACRKTTLPALQSLLCRFIRDTDGLPFSAIGRKDADAELSRTIQLLEQS